MAQSSQVPVNAMFTLVLGFRGLDDPEPTNKYLMSIFYDLFRSLCKNRGSQCPNDQESDY